MMKNKKANQRFSCFPRVFGSQKRGLVRIIEVVIAIMIFASVLLVAYSRTTERPDISDYVYDLENRILKDISSNETLRNFVLENNSAEIKFFARKNIPANFNSEVMICESVITCRMGEIMEKDVYVAERIMGSNLEKYGPKIIRLFVWEAGE